MAVLIEVQAAWHLVKKWAGDQITFPDLERELSSLRAYDYTEWRKVFKRIEVTSDPSEEHAVSLVDIIVEEVKRRDLNAEKDNGEDGSSDELDAEILQDLEHLRHPGQSGTQPFTTTSMTLLITTQVKPVLTHHMIPRNLLKPDAITWTFFLVSNLFYTFAEYS
ncbi:hypothetical protein JVU11DRAFT_2546 [Chiua virens]|nr:hypothetical protein JVU11DRAFT_2546 [Chiua virens]